MYEEIDMKMWKQSGDVPKWDGGLSLGIAKDKICQQLIL